MRKNWLRHLMAAAGLAASLAGTQAQNITDGLVVHWKLDEGTGAAAQDSSGNNHPGDLLSFAGDDSQWIDGKMGKAVLISGGGYVAVAGLPTIQSTTWSAWLRLDAPSANDAAISATFTGANAGHSLGFQTGATALNPRVLWNHNAPSTSLVSPTAVALQQWNHVALTYDSAARTLRLYLNGEQKGISTNAAGSAFSSINLGRREAQGSGLSPFHGAIDEVRIYDRALSLIEVQQLAGKVVTGPPVVAQAPAAQTVYQGGKASFTVVAEGLAPFTYQWMLNGSPLAGATASSLDLVNITLAQQGNYTVQVTNAEGTSTSAAAQLTVIAIEGLQTGLQAHWKMDETTGLLAEDSSANSNDAVLANFLGDDSQWVPGAQGGALAFDGQNYAEAPDHESLGAKLVDGFSVSTWFNSNVPLSTAGNTARMFEKGDSIFLIQGDGNTNNVGSGGMNLVVKRNNAIFAASLGTALQSNRWYNLSGTFDGQMLRVYLDGELRGAKVVGANIDDDHLPLRIGSDDAGKFFNGRMDEVRVWDRPLSDREIRNIMGRDLPVAPSIVAQPITIEKYAGATATFSVEARGQEPFRYLWFKGTEPIRSATGPVLTLGTLSAADAGSYRVQVSNDLGEITSSPAVLTVLAVENLGTAREAYWKFDETSGLIAADSSGRGHNGDLIDFLGDDSQWAPGRINGALRFDGVASRVVIPNSGAVDFGTEPSFAFWIKPEGYGTEQSAGTYMFREGRILRKGNHVDLFTVDNPGGVRETIVARGASAPQTSLQLGSWQHFTVVFRQGLVYFYKDGFPAGVPQPGAPGAVDLAELVIGNFSAGTETPRFLHGFLDELQVWTRPLGESEVLELAGKDVAGAPVFEVQPIAASKLVGNTVEFSVVVTGKRPVTYEWFRSGQAVENSNTNRLVLAGLTVADAGTYTVRAQNEAGSATSAPAELAVTPITSVATGLVAYWDFNAVDGTAVPDASGHGHAGTIQNGAVAAPGLIGGALDFDGTDDFVTVPHHPQLNLEGEGTISVWVSPRSLTFTGGLGRVVRKSINYDFTLNGNFRSVSAYGINKTLYNAPTNVVDIGLWQQFAVVFKGSTVQFFKNGQSLGNPIPGRLGEINTAELVIGNFEGNLNIVRLFNGLMDDLGVWNRALTAVEIDGIYQNGKLGKPLTASFEPLNIGAIRVNAGQIQLEFFSPYPNRQYAVQRKISLGALAWEEVANVTLANPAPGQFTAAFAAATDAAQFYQVIALAPPPVFVEGFETGAAGWTHGGAADTWELGTPTNGPGSAHSGQSVYATSLTGEYLPLSDAYLLSPPIDLTTVRSGTLRFWEFRDVDADINFHYTKVSVLDAVTLQPLTELARDAGSTAGWQPRSFKLGGGVLGQRVVLEFRLVSDQFFPRQGWYLDDIEIVPE